MAARAGAQFTLGREGDGVQHTFTQLGGFLGGYGNLGLGGCPTDLGYADLTDAADLTRARRLGLNHLYERVVETEGWHDFLYIGPPLGLRQSRQIVGDYQLTLADQIAARCFDDCIGYMQAHFDDHAFDYENESDEAALWTWLLGGWGEIIGCEVPTGACCRAGSRGCWWPAAGCP